MKINARILLIILTVVAFVSITSTIIYNSLAYSFLQSQHSKTLLNSTNLFIFSFQLQNEKIEDDFQKIISENLSLDSIELTNNNIDFIFTLNENNEINSANFFAKDFVIKTAPTLNDFLDDNKNAVLKYRTIGRETYYYGYIITEKLLTNISEKIQAEISLIVDGNLKTISNLKTSKPFSLYIERAYSSLKYKNNFDLAGEELAYTDFLASIYTPTNILSPSGRISFLIFSSSKEAAEFRDTMRFISILIVLVSITLSVIIVLIFTTKLRKQVSLLSQTAELTSQGNLRHRTKIILKDEIGKFGEAFNNMLDKLSVKEKSEKDYAEFIALLNKNPTLIEVSEQALAKIINSTGLTLGLLYLVENNELRMVSSFGISDEVIKPSGEIDFYKNVIKKKEISEFDFKDNNPVIKTGIAEIKIEYLLVAPIIYNQKVIAIIELASEKKPVEDVKEYIKKIQEQLAVGLTNAKALEQLENIIDELQILNEQYQKQNKQITDQNVQLIELHEKLKQNAEELEEQRAKAVELTKVKSDFLASMSHELRTPLNSILGLTELVIKDSTSTNKTKERLDIVLRNGNKLLTLINNILEFSKIETGKIELKIETFRLNDFAKDIFKFAEPLVLEKELNFSVKYNFENDLLIESDKSKIEQIIINLLGNAVKFTEDGFVTMQFSKSSTSLIIKVEDTGIGIEDEYLTEIFNEFKQIDSSTSRNYGGTGLGLAICKKYVLSLNGNIKVESKIGKGTIFIVSLPNVIKDELSNTPIENLILEKEFNNQTDLFPVLIVNNNKQTQKLIGDYLQNNNHQVKIFSNGQDALDFITSEKFEAIIVDINITDITPWSFLVKAQQILKHNIPILLTAIDDRRKVGYGFNVCKYIEKVEDINFENIIGYAKKSKNILYVGNRRDVSIENAIIDYFTDNQTIANNNYDVIIINIFENNFKGIELYFELKKNKDSRDIPIIFEIDETNLNKKSFEVINKIQEDVINENHHPMDVLKVIRDRLQISSDPQNIIDLSHETKTLEALHFNDIETEMNNKRKGKILIVDDDNDTLFTVGEIVNDLGFETYYAKNGVECLLSLNNTTPDIILLDIMMPQMDGFETIKRIRQNNKYGHLTVIALTAYAMLDNKEIIEKNGFNDLITKPVKTSEIKTKLKFYINKLLRK